MKILVLLSSLLLSGNLIAAPAQLHECVGIDNLTNEFVGFHINYADSAGPGTGYATEEIVYKDGKTFPLNRASDCSNPDQSLRFPEVNMSSTSHENSNFYNQKISASCEAEIWFDYEVICKSVY